MTGVVGCERRHFIPKCFFGLHKNMAVRINQIPGMLMLRSNPLKWNQFYWNVICQLSVRLLELKCENFLVTWSWWATNFSLLFFSWNDPLQTFTVLPCNSWYNIKWAELIFFGCSNTTQFLKITGCFFVHRLLIYPHCDKRKIVLGIIWTKEDMVINFDNLFESSSRIIRLIGRLLGAPDTIYATLIKEKFG